MLRCGRLRQGNVLMMAFALALFGSASARGDGEASSEGLQTYDVARPHDETLDLSLPEEDPIVENRDDDVLMPSASHSEGDRSPQRADMQQDLGGDWKLDTVLLHRNQAGGPADYEDDLSPVTVGGAVSHHF